MDNQSWINKPEFLHVPGNMWPDRPYLLGVTIDDVELKHSATANLIQATECAGALTNFINYYSSFFKLKLKKKQ